MRVLKFLALVALCAGLTGCSCFTKRVGSENIARASDGGPLADVRFAFDSAELDASSQEALKAHAAWLKDNGSTTVQIEGHCDERGTNEYNMALGARRARTTLEYLRNLGIAETRMSTVSYGEEVPLDPRHSEEAWSKNRRAHFNVSGWEK